MITAVAKRAAVITVSDSVSAGSRLDVSGPSVRGLLESTGWTVESHVVSDDRSSIASLLRTLLGRCPAIFTTGGTGVANRDVTPEATRDVIEREIPGFGELMRVQGKSSTPFAALSRALAGTRDGSIIVNLPGSPKGAVDALSTVIDLIPHVIDLLEGRTSHETGFEKVASHE